MLRKTALGLLMLLVVGPLFSQQDTVPPATEEEDYSQYGSLDFADEKAKRYCSSKILDQSPQRFISLSWDHQFAYDMSISALGSYPPDLAEPAAYDATGRSTATGGPRFMANIPVISRNSVIWQLGANFWEMRYAIDRDPRTADRPPSLLDELDERGLRTMGLNTTVFKPLNETRFLIFQASADLSGDYTSATSLSAQYLRYSGAVIYGKRPHDRLQWGIGVSRTYRVGEMNYIPLVLYNYTAANRKWGVEALFPARAAYRRTFSARSLLLTGYELEGQSYRMVELSGANNSLEIRRSELRLRTEYQRRISGFVWLTLQAGYRQDWSFNTDQLPKGREFFRGFFGDQPYAQLNSLGGAPYFQVGIHLVSP